MAHFLHPGPATGTGQAPDGNWAIGTEQGPRLHLHLYGRACNSRNQLHGEALYFPPKATQFWRELEALTEADQSLIKSHLEKLALEERYRLEAWGLKEG